jgi:hypothetical protein
LLRPRAAFARGSERGSERGLLDSLDSFSILNTNNESYLHHP